MSHRTLSFGRFTFDPHVRILYQHDQIVPLTSRSAEVLGLLLERPGEVITREEFLQSVWKDTFVEQRNLTQCIFLLRKALDDPHGDSVIETVAKRGYRFIAPVRYHDPLPNETSSVARSSPRFHPALIRRSLMALGVCAIILAAVWAWNGRRSPRPAGFRALDMARLTWTGSAHDPDVSPDGKFIVYVAEDPSARYAVYRLDLPSSTTRIITPPTIDPVESPGISSDGQWVAYRSSAGDGVIMVVPSDGSRPPVPVTDSSRGRQPRWQPSRHALSYWIASEEHNRALGQVRYQSIDPAAKPFRILDGFDTATSPLWSPDGSVLLCLGTSRSGVRDQEFDAWLSTFNNGVPTTGPIRSGLFDLLRTRGLYSTVRDRSRITVSGWRGNYLYLSIHNGSAANIYRIRIGSDSRVFGEPEQLTSSANLLLAPRISNTGPLVFSSITLAQQPVRLSFDGTSLQPIPYAQGGLARLAIAPDGSRIAAEQYTPGEPLRIISTAYGSTSTTLITKGSVAFPVISPDGRSVAWRSMEGRKQSIELAPAAGGPTRRICEDCGAPEDWLPDSSAVLFHTGGTPARIGLVEISSGQPRDWILHQDYGVFAPRIHHPSGQPGWVTFYAENTQRTRRIYVAPVNGYRQIPPSTWIPITEGTYWDSSPAWAPSGNTVYFVSQRDGHRCIYSIRLHPATRRTLGPPQPVRHFHSYSESLALFNPARGAENLRAAAGGLYLILDDVSSNIWSIPSLDARP